MGGAHTCFVDAKQALWCWGGNTYGQVGNGTHGFGGRTENTDWAHDTVKAPTRIAALDGKAKAVGCGTQRTCALTVEGAIYCWGMDENPKRLEMFSDLPVLREIGGKSTALALEVDHSCALREDRTLWCWGSNYNGQLGAGPPAPGTAGGYAAATQLKPFGNDISQVAVVEEGTCVLKHDGTLWCLGENGEGEFGDGSTEKRPQPVRAISAEKLLGVAGGKRHVCAIAANGRLLCWGRNYEGQLGNGQTPKTKPVRYATAQAVTKAFAGIRALDLGYAETLVVDGAGELYALGDLSSSVRGVAPQPDSTPRKVPMPGPVVEIRANRSHRCALLADDGVWCWGEGGDGALGTGHAEAHMQPARVVFPE